MTSVEKLKAGKYPFVMSKTPLFYDADKNEDKKEAIKRLKLELKI